MRPQAFSSGRGSTAGRGSAAAASSTRRSAAAGAQKGCFIKNPPNARLHPVCYGSDGAFRGYSLFIKRQVKKKRRRLDRKSKRLRRISAHTGQRQLAVCPADGIPGLCRPCSDGTARKVPCVDGRSSFFQIAAFLLREGGGVFPSTLECRPIYSISALSIAARCPAPCGSLDAFAQRSSYTLIQL